MTRVSKGFKQEIAVSNFFSKLGYFTRFHVQLYPKDGKISDIDVYCIKFDNHLMPTRNIIETKRSNDSSTAIFQLFGLKNFYENCNAFFVIEKVSQRTISITDKLNIKVYSFSRLRELSKNGIIPKKYFEPLKNSFNDGEWVFYKHTGHNIHREDFDSFINTVKNFIVSQK